MDFVSPLEDRGRLIFITIMNAIFWLFFVPLAFVYGEIVNVFRRSKFLDGIFKNSLFAALLAIYWFTPSFILSYIASQQVSLTEITQVSLTPLILFIIAGILGLIATIIYPVSLFVYARYGKHAFNPKVVFIFLATRFFIYIKIWAIWILLSLAAMFILYLVPFFAIFGIFPFLLFCFVEAYILLAFAYGIRKVFEGTP